MARPVGVSRRQDRSAARRPRRRSIRELKEELGIETSASLPRAADLRQPRLRRLPPADAALRLPALAGHAAGPRGAGAEMGAADGAPRLSDAAGRPAADRAVNRSFIGLGKNRSPSRGPYPCQAAVLRRCVRPCPVPPTILATRSTSSRSTNRVSRTRIIAFVPIALALVGVGAILFGGVSAPTPPSPRAADARSDHDRFDRSADKPTRSPTIEMLDARIGSR